MFTRSGLAIEGDTLKTHRAEQKPMVVDGETQRRLQDVVQQLTAHTNADYVCVVRCLAGGQVEWVAKTEGIDWTADACLRLERFFHRRVTRLPAAVEPVDFDADIVRESGFAAVRAYRLEQTDPPFHVLALSVEDETELIVANDSLIDAHVGLARSLLENQRLQAVTTRYINTLRSLEQVNIDLAPGFDVQAILSHVKPQLVSDHVSSCALLLYGPVSSDANSRFEYLQMEATCTRKHGDGIGLGIHLYIDEFTDLLDQLYQQGQLIYEDAREFARQLDPLTRMFIRLEKVRSLALLALSSGTRQIGVLFIGTDRRHRFTPQELVGYRMIGGYLASSVYMHLLSAQREEMNRVRAALLDTISDGVMMVVPGSRGAEIVTVNQRFGEIFGLTDGVAQGLQLAALIDRLPLSGLLRDELYHLWLKLPVRDPSTQEGEFHMTAHDGSPLDIEWQSAPVYRDADVVGRIFTFNDVSAERMASRLRSTFLSRISHELRTPLTSISGFAQLILDTVPDDLPDIAFNYIEIILNSAQHLNHVFTDIIQLSRADTGELKLNRVDAHLPDVIIQVVANLELQYKSKSQRIIMDIDDNLPPVSIDIDRIVQVLTNLILNASKYSPHHTTITIHTQVAAAADDLPSAAPNETVTPAVIVTVLDEGNGLTHDEIQQVFLPFFRASDAQAQRVEGVGLGLTITRSIVEMHRGKIWAEPSHPERPGGVFRFSVPLST